jgi:hypothetical protein
VINKFLASSTIKRRQICLGKKKKVDVERINKPVAIFLPLNGYIDH